jgi:hypothetical protein
VTSSAEFLIECFADVNVQLDVVPQLTNELQYSCDFGFGSGAVVAGKLMNISPFCSFLTDLPSFICIFNEALVHDSDNQCVHLDFDAV